MRTLVLGLFLLAFPALAAAPAPQSPLVQAHLASAAKSITPGTPFDVTLELTMPAGWHTYADPAGDAGIPTALKWQLPEGFSAGPIRWPAAQTLHEDTLTVYAYTGHIALPVRITPPARLGESRYTLKAEASWLVCKDICIPETREVSLELPAGAGGAAPPAMGIAGALLAALIGGLILNLMPCVFPVLSLKCIAVARQGHFTPAQARAEGLAYTLGVMACFALVAGALLAFKAGGEAIGWGYQMQSPAFVAGLALLLFVIGLNLSGLFTLPVLLGETGTELTREPTLKGSFATGALATLVATPCTAPFMAAAVGYALAQPWFAALLVFEALGLGLALPFLLVSFFPRLLRALPRPGAWMENFRQILAFPMYLSAVWLVWVLAQQASVHSVGAVLVAATMIVFIFWARQLFPRAERAYHIAAPLLVLAVAAVTLHFVQGMRAEMRGASALLHGGMMYDAAKLEELRARGMPVFVDATAAWCITCQVNYHDTLATDAVQNAFKEKGVVFMVADWTSENPAITAFLDGFGYKGVPLYVYFPPHGEPKVLPQLLTPGVVLGVIDTTGE